MNDPTQKADRVPHFRPQIDEADVAAVAEALRGCHLSDGEVVSRLEADLSAAFEGPEAVAVASGTAALYLSLVALGVRPGHQVLIPSYTCNSLYAAVVHAGAEPVCADIAAGGLSLSADAVSAAMRRDVRALIVPHTCGYLAEIEAIRRLGVPVIEDCAHAVGGRYPDGSAVGLRGDVGVLSLYATKLLPSGEGGVCITRRPEVAASIRRLLNCDGRPLDPHAFNFKLADLSAALARSRLRRLDIDLACRERLAARYDSVFRPWSFRLAAAQRQAVCFRYLVRVEQGLDAFLRDAVAAGIVCRRPVYRPLHLTLGGACPRADERHAQIASIPLYPGLRNEEIDTILTRLPPLLSSPAP